MNCTICGALEHEPCDKCGQIVHVGQHPFCPHGDPSLRVRQDSIIGGFWAENAWREPKYFDSQKRYEKALDADGLMLKPKRIAGERTMDAQTLENARRLVARMGTVPVTTRTLDETLTVSAEIE